jgi:alanyl aminopeptidase
LELSLDARLRRNEISLVLGAQLRNPRTRDAAWRWLVAHYDRLVERIGLAQAGSLPWYVSSFCTREAAREIEEFFEPRMREAAGGPRNLSSAIEAIELCAARVEAQRPGIDRAFSATRP